MLVPALIFVALNWGSPANLRSLAIPAATDIAFALGVLALLGKRIPAGLKVLLLAIAIIDDIGAIAIIAMFYASEVSTLALGLAALAAALLFALNRLGVTRLSPYVLIGLVLWVCVLKSGVHATLAIPLTARDGSSPLKHLEHVLHPWIAFGVLPIFAFANAGVSFAGFSWNMILAPVPLGIALGLVVGKQLGVFGFMATAIKFGWARLPDGVSLQQLYGLACITGIGFTISLFIGNLAFDGAQQIEAVKMGVMLGSAISGVAGYLILRAYATSPD